MRLGVFGPWLEPWSSARSTWQHLEQIGLDVAYLGDHLTHPTLKGRWFSDAYATLAAVAQVTTRLELGTLVASAVIRAPAPLARVAATLQDLSGGRFVLGVGAGVPGDEEVVSGGDQGARSVSRSSRRPWKRSRPCGPVPRPGPGATSGWKEWIHFRSCLVRDGRT